jgi:hypothetical protein
VRLGGWASVLPGRGRARAHRQGKHDAGNQTLDLTVITTALGTKQHTPPTAPAKQTTQPDIRKAYLRLAVQLHPDKNPGDEVSRVWRRP